MKKLLIPIGLFGLWVVLLAVQMLIIEKSFTLIAENYSKEVFGFEKKTRNIATRKLSAQFTAKDNYLGIVSVNFDQRNKIVQGTITFRIKEVGSPDWYYENDYDARQLNDLAFYPFGFPIIENSKDRKYEIYAELKNTGKFDTMLKLSNSAPALTTLHKYPKAPLLESRAAFFAFLYKKVVNIVHNNYQVFGSIVCMYPFIFYFFSQLVAKRYLKKFLTGTLIVTMLLDTVFILQFFDMAYVTVAVLWLLLHRSDKNASRGTYHVAFGFLLFCVFTQLLNHSGAVEKSASWAFLFIVLAIIQDIPALGKR